MYRKLMTLLLAMTILGAPLAAGTGSALVATGAQAAQFMGWYKARAKMRDGEVRGKARYKEKDRHGTLEQRLVFKIEHAQPNTEFDVKINGETMGTLMTNSLGKGKIKFRTAEFIDDPDWIPLPPNFPTIVDGDVAEIGPYSATFRVRS